MLDSCVCTGLGVQLCHSTCAIGYRRPVVVFEGIVDFLNKNPNEIVILELQIGIDSFEGLYDKMLEAGNFTSYMYNHPDRTAPWPIVNDLIANNTVCTDPVLLFGHCFGQYMSNHPSHAHLCFTQRLIIFQHDGPDCNAGMCPPGFHNTFEFVMETAWNATELEGLMKFNETCVRTRGRKRSAFMLSNHFATNSLGLPEQEIAEEVNMAVHIRNRTDACTEMLGRMTNLLAVDYWSIGDTLQVVEEYNMALPAITESPSMSPMPSTGPSAAPTLSPRPSAQPTNTETTAPTEAPVLDTVAPVLPVFEPMDESFAPSGGADVDTSMPTGTSAPVSAASVSPAPVLDLAPVTETQGTFSPALTPALIQEDALAPTVSEDTAFPTWSTFTRNGDY